MSEFQIPSEFIEKIQRLEQFADESQKKINQLLKLVSKMVDGDENKLLTTKEVAKMINRDVVTIKAWRKKNINLKYAKLKGRIVYVKKDVLEYLKNKHDEGE